MAFNELRQEVSKLEHRTHRTHGTGDLYAQYHLQITRRAFGDMVREERERQKRKHRDNLRQIEWLKPRLVWAMDDAEYRPSTSSSKAFLHDVQDLSSRFRFAPLVGLRPAHGQEVADNLARLFKAHGAPLFLKRDNGGNLNHHLVDELLEENLVIPLNSPCAYPQYNGCIEHAQREVKDALRLHEILPGSLEVHTSLDVHEANHRPRAVLKHRTACAVFTEGRAEARKYTKRKRREVYDWIKDKSLEFMAAEAYAHDKAWRTAVEIWLIKHRFIAVKKRKSVTPLSKKSVS